MPLLLLTPDLFELAACRVLATRMRNALTEGVSFAVVDRIPLEGITLEEAKALYWLFSGMIARPVAQKLDGTMVYDVHDTGKRALPGSGVRPDKTNVDLTFHNDNAYNQTMPEIVGLFCLRQAQAGGLSRAISFQTEHYMQPGQIQYVNNRAIGHSRTAFVDHADPGLRRYLVRLWLRDAAHRGYCG